MFLLFQIALCIAAVNAKGFSRCKMKGSNIRHHVQPTPSNHSAHTLLVKGRFSYRFAIYNGGCIQMNNAKMVTTLNSLCCRHANSQILPFAASESC